VLREIHGHVIDPGRIDRAEATVRSMPPDQLARVRQALPHLRIDDETLFETQLDAFISGVRSAAGRGRQ
jgi:hypothetical protein